MGFGGEVDDGGGAGGAAGFEGGLDFIRVGDIAFDEFVAGGLFDAGEAFGGGGVGEGVGVDEGDVGEEGVGLAEEFGADEAPATGDEPGGISEVGGGLGESGKRTYVSLRVVGSVYEVRGDWRWENLKGLDVNKAKNAMGCNYLFDTALRFGYYSSDKPLSELRTNPRVGSVAALSISVGRGLLWRSRKQWTKSSCRCGAVVLCACRHAPARVLDSGRMSR